jgi:parallel beta-helix repeat protein
MVYGFLLLSGLGVVIAQGLPLLRTVSMPHALDQPQRDNQPRQITSFLPPSPSQFLSQASQSVIPAFKPPAGAIAIAPGTNIQAIVDRYPPRTAFLLKAGVHRLQRIIPKNGMSFYGEVAPNGTLLTTLNGSNKISKFERAGKLYVITGQTQENPVPGSRAGLTRSGYERAAVHAEDVYLNSRPLRHVGSLSEVVPGTFFFDYAADRVYLADNPTGKTVEVSAKGQAIDKWTGTTDVKVRNLIIEKYATGTHVGAINGGSGWVLEGNEVRLNHALGVDLKSNSIVRRNYIHSNGYQGINAGNSSNILIEGNESSFNNFNRFRFGWGGGGMKFGLTQNVVIRGNFVHSNDQKGIWFDVDARDSLIENNQVENNTSEGILYEVSRAGIIRGNRVSGNGQEGNWMYGSQILISSSADTKVYGNFVEVPAKYGKGISIIQQKRGSGKYGPHLSKNNEVYDNKIIYQGMKSDDPFHAISGVAGEGDLDVFKLGNKFFKNIYFWPPDASPKRFAWKNKLSTLQQLQAEGQELGSLAKNVP